jgi:ESS family glutamate:Na+ symporter
MLLGSLLIANIFKRRIPFLKNSLIPNSVLGGMIILIVEWIYKLISGNQFFSSAMFGADGHDTLEIITYHCLALGFIASSLKTTGGKITKKRFDEIINTGVTTVSTYLLQGIVGLVITIVAAHIVSGFFAAAGILLPFGYGQGTGQALNWGAIYEQDWGFINGKSFGLTIAAFGFISAAVGGVIHLNAQKKAGRLKLSSRTDGGTHYERVENYNEIPMQESVDKITVQLAFIFLAYGLAYTLMAILGNLIPGMKATIYGFNFLLGVLMATLVKVVVNKLYLKKLVTRKYLNNFLMTRLSNLFFDIMVVAGVAAIRIEALEKYWPILLILGFVGLIVTYVYNRIIAKKLFSEYYEEQFMAMFGMLTGTASTGVILLREIDPDFKTPVSDNLVYQNFPAIVLGFPLMILANLAPKNPVLTVIIFAAMFLALNIFLFRSFIFKRKNKKDK